MKKNLSYREKLLELAQIYKISEIQNYIKRKKNLTTQQIEHILKKNNVPIPKDLNVSFFKKSISNPISKAGKEVSGIYSDTTDGFGKFFKRTKRTNSFRKFRNIFKKKFEEVSRMIFGSLYYRPRFKS